MGWELRVHRKQWSIVSTDLLLDV